MNKTGKSIGSTKKVKEPILVDLVGGPLCGQVRLTDRYIRHETFHGRTHVYVLVQRLNVNLSIYFYKGLI